METDENETRRPFCLILSQTLPWLALPQHGPGRAPNRPDTLSGTEAYPADLLLSPKDRDKRGDSCTFHAQGHLKWVWKPRVLFVCKELRERKVPRCTPGS